MDCLKIKWIQKRSKKKIEGKWNVKYRRNLRYKKEMFVMQFERKLNKRKVFF